MYSRVSLRFRFFHDSSLSYHLLLGEVALYERRIFWYKPLVHERLQGVQKLKEAVKMLLKVVGMIATEK